MTKQAANYKIIGGMRAVGIQCKDCKHHSGRGTSWCFKIEQQVNDHAHCEHFTEKEQEA